MTLRSKPREDCAHCNGSGIISVSKDPDEIADCVCTDPPQRIQLSRRKGWRKPENTVVVARPSKYGNPVRIVPVRKRGPFDLERDGVGFIGQNTDLEGARRSAVVRYRDMLMNHPHLVQVTIDQIRAELAGKNLACWCRLDQPCHADVMLEIANGGTS